MGRDDRRDGTDHNQLSADVFDTLDAVVVLALAESLRVDVGGEVAHSGSDAFVEGAAEGEVAAETHAGCALWRLSVILSQMRKLCVETYCET